MVWRTLCHVQRMIVLYLKIRHPLPTLSIRLNCILMFLTMSSLTVILIFSWSVTILTLCMWKMWRIIAPMPIARLLLNENLNQVLRGNTSTSTMLHQSGLVRPFSRPTPSSWELKFLKHWLKRAFKQNIFVVYTENHLVRFFSPFAHLICILLSSRRALLCAVNDILQQMMMNFL